MADYSITADQTGAYELPLTAGQPITIDITNRYGYTLNRVQVSVHQATAPVYARLGNTITTKDPNAQVIAPGTWLDIQTGYGETSTSSITLISANDATVSVARS